MDSAPEEDDSETSSRASTPDLQQDSAHFLPRQPKLVDDEVDFSWRPSPTPPKSILTRHKAVTPESLIAPYKTTNNNTSSSKKNIISSSSVVVRHSGSSCGEEFANRSQQLQKQQTIRNSSYPRDTGRRHFIRERAESEDLLVNLLNLRELLLSQNVHV